MTVKVQTVRGRSTSHGFARVAAASFWTRPAAIEQNLQRHLEAAREADAERVQLLVFPELGLTGYACRDLFRDDHLRVRALEALRTFCDETQDMGTVFVVGLPLALNGLYNVAAVVIHGEVLALIPKSFLAARSEWQEDEWFVPASHLQTESVILPWQKEAVPIGTDILIEVMDENDEEQVFVLGVEICADGWQAGSPGDRLALNGATVIANLSASNWVLGKDKWREVVFPASSGQQKAVYIYCTMAGDSTASVTWDGHCFIAEDGNILARSKRWLTPTQSDLSVADVDIARLLRDRMVDGEWAQAEHLHQSPHRKITAFVRTWPADVNDFRRPLTRMPFVPKDAAVMHEVATELFQGLAQGLIGRLWTMKNGQPIDTYLGLSGGSDSTLVYLIACYVYDRLGWDRKHLHAVRLPGPASSTRTQRNSRLLAQAMGTSLHTVNITKLATRALRDVGHEPCWQCLQCENAQARARTFVLMTYGFVLGTGDMTEKVLGWATYNGDQMSMYDVIAGVPKTLVRYLIAAYVEHMTKDMVVRRTLRSILAEVISPELVKVKPGEPIQSSEAKIGPYDLNDFFLYHVIRTGATPARIAFLAQIAFSRKERETDLIYNLPTILTWLKSFYSRFNPAQYKRNAGADSVLIGSVGIGPHDKLRLPSDGDVLIYLREVEAMLTAVSSCTEAAAA